MLRAGVKSERTTGGRLGPARAGQTLAEFALILVVFVMIIMGIVDLSRALYARSVVANAAREGARYGAMQFQDEPQDFDGIEEAAKSKVAGLDMSKITVKVTPNPQVADVEVTYRFHPVTVLIAHYVDGGTGAGILLRSRSVMRREW